MNSKMVDWNSNINWHIKYRMSEHPHRFFKKQEITTCLQETHFKQNTNVWEINAKNYTNHLALIKRTLDDSLKDLVKQLNL